LVSRRIFGKVLIFHFVCPAKIPRRPRPNSGAGAPFGAAVRRPRNSHLPVGFQSIEVYIAFTLEFNIKGRVFFKKNVRYPV